MRILPNTHRLGTQTLLVDAQGDGDTTSIQAALDIAANFATLDSPWSVRVAPGTYSEQLILRDYVDLLGLGPGRATRMCRQSGAVISQPATCTVANLWIETSDTPAIALDDGFSGVLDLDGVIVDQAALDVQAVQVAGGTLRLARCLLASGGAVELSGGTLLVHHSVIRNQAVYDGGQNMALYIQHGTLLLHGCLVENVSPAGYAVYIDNSVTSLKGYHTVFRAASATYAIHTALPATFSLAACCGNAALHPDVAGFHDYVWDGDV